MKFLQKCQYKTWWGELCGNIFTMLLSLSFISFLAVATEGSLMAVAATSFWWSWRAKKRPLLSGMLPSVSASTVLQLGYFMSGRQLFPPAAMAEMFFGNMLIISLISFVFSAIGTWIRNRKIKKEKIERETFERNQSRFSERVRSLAMVTLFFYVTMFLVVPLAAKVEAASKQTSDEFIQNYDPDNTYTVTSKIVDAPVKRHVPLESSYTNVTGTELEQLESYCQINGCSLTNVAEQLNLLRQSGTVTMTAYLQQLDKAYAPIPPVSRWQNSLVFPKVIKGLKDSLTGKNKSSVKGKSAKPDNRPWWQKGVDTVTGAYKAYQRFDRELGRRLIQEPLEGAWKFATKHPVQAVVIAAAAVAITVSAVVWAPVALAVTAAAMVMASVSAYGVAKAYHDGGWNGVRSNVFSKETQAMWKAGDIAGASGRGTAEITGKALELLPLAGTPKAAANVMKLLPEVRVGIAIVDDAGVLNSGAMKILNKMSKVAGENIDSLKALNPFVKTLPENQAAIAILNIEGKAVESAESVAGATKGLVAEKKAGELVGNVVKKELNNTPLTQDTFRELNVPNKEFHAVQMSNKSYGVKADTSNFEEGSLQHIFEGEVNRYGKMVGMHTEQSVNSPGRIIPGTEATTVRGVYQKGVYQGEVELNGLTKATNGGKSTFFPKEWSKEQTIEEIDSAFQNKTWDYDNNIYVGESKSGIIIEMHLDSKTGKITSPRPKWPQVLN